jgi:glycosyltransferase involved in cell wall biosynthesis
LPSKVEKHCKTVVMTVAHGDGFMAAKRFAKRHELPLVVFFQDWWPDIAEVPRFFRRILENQFLGLARGCAVGLCVCEGMRDALGAGDNLQVLPPIPALREISENEAEPTDHPNSPFRVLYSGNLGEYGPMLGEALEESLKHPEILLQVRGSNPQWSDELKRKMRANGRWLEFAPREEFEKWFDSFDAYLVAMFFEPEQRRRVETCFATKLMEYLAIGKPVVIWAPESAAVTKWANSGERAYCVNSPDPDVLLRSLSMLAEDLPLQIQLGNAARFAYERDCSPVQLQNEFLLSLRRAF